ncbi:MAG: LamG domain-containing protein [Anaerolineae bacterium]|nr:LamG domain-containing protein [Anaerolineae bacterium]
MAPSASATQDQSITNNPAQFIGNVTATVGHTGSGVSLSGQGFVATERNLRWLSEDFTLAAWVKTTVMGDDVLTRSPALAGNRGEAMDNSIDPSVPKFERRYDKTGNRFLVVGGLDSAGKIGLSLGTDLSTTVKSAQAINDGAWHHVALMRDMASGQVKVYVDGALSASGSLAPGSLYQRAFSLGRLENPLLSNYWQGGLDELRIYNRLLADAEVLRLYRDQPIDEPPPTPTPTPTTTPPPPSQKKVFLPVVVKR